MSTRTKATFALQVLLALAAGLVALVAPWWAWVSLLAVAVLIAPDTRVEVD